VLEAGTGTKFLTNSANPTLWTLFGSHKELGGASHSITSYACEVWVDSKKIEAIEVVYQGFLKSFLEVRITTSTSIVLTKIGKFPFEYFAWGRALLYYNRVNTITKDCIFGKAWEAQLVMFAARKKRWVGSMKKWLLKN
jgi:hypothetical protein